MPSQLSIIRSDTIDRTLWRRLSSSMPVPLQQHWAYGETLKAIDADIDQLTILQDGHLMGLALVGRRRFYKLLTLNSLMRGPLWLPTASDAVKEDAFKALRRQHSPWRWNFLALQPELDETEEYARLLKQNGYRRIMTGYSTIWLDIAAEAEVLRASLNGKWRNQLKAAEKAKVDISIGGRKQHQYAWLTDKEAEQRSKRRYQATPLGLVPLYAGIADRFAPDDPTVGILSVTAIAGKRKLAGALFLLHGASATYQIGWTGEEGRRTNAQNRVLWEAILALKERGIRFLDLGGVNTAEGAGIARFKLGLGAAPTTLIGTWL